MKGRLLDGVVRVEYVLCNREGCLCRLGGAMHGPRFYHRTRKGGQSVDEELDEAGVAALFEEMTNSRTAQDQRRKEKAAANREALRVRVLRGRGLLAPASREVAALKH